MKVYEQLHEGNRDLRQNIWYAVLIIFTVLLGYVIFLHPTASTDASSDLDTPAFYRVPAGSTNYAALVISNGRGDVVDLGQGPFVSSSDSDADLDRSSDTAWVAVMRNWNCPVDYLPVEGVLSDGRTASMASIEGKELPVALGVGGHSGGVTYALAQATIASGYSPDVAVAATGVVSVDGNVLPVGGVGYKMIAASAAGAEVVFVPWANAEEARLHAPEGLEVVAISHISTAFSSLGFPNSVDCAEAGKL